MSETVSAEALRIVRSVEVQFPTGPPSRGSAFVVAPGKLITCAHVVLNDAGQQGNSAIVWTRDGVRHDATVGAVSRRHDLARLDVPSDTEAQPQFEISPPSIGRSVIFAGWPRGVRRLAVFPGMVSDFGDDLISKPRCEMIQLAGMINNGNSGGPLLDASEGHVLGVVTAKYVPLLAEIDELTKSLKQIPQVPSDVGIGNVDFAKFVNLTIQSMWQIGAVLRLVQVGTGWAVPAQYFSKVGV